MSVAVAMLCLLGAGVGLTVIGGAVAFSIAKVGHLIKKTERPAEGLVPEDLGPAPLFSSWPAEKPDLALVLTGEMFGYLRPCGCSPGQHGGLARRGGFLDHLKKEKGWQVLPLDLGDLIKQSGLLESTRYDFALESLKKLDYPAVGIGKKDLGLSVMEILGKAVNSEPTKLLFANIQAKDAGEQEFIAETIKGVAIIPAGNLKVAVADVMGESSKDKLPDPSVTLRSIDEEIPKILKASEGADLKVLLAHMPAAEAAELAKKHPGFDLIVCESRIEDSADQEANWVGKTMVTWVGQKGKSVGVVGFWKSGEPRLRFTIALLDGRFPEVESMQAVYARFVQSIKDSNFIEQMPKNRYMREDTYVGAKECGKCHTKAYAKWKDSKHAHAMDSLVSAKPAGQDYNPECVKCHATGYEYQGGFVSPVKTPTLAGNQCENCHGPGGKHSQEPKNQEWIVQMRLSKHTVEQTTCIKCHDSENSPKFIGHFNEYWEKIAHPWRD